MITSIMFAIGTLVVAFNPELLEQADKWERLQVLPGGVSRWFALVPFGAFILYRLFLAAWKLQDEAEKRAEDGNRRADRAEAQLNERDLKRERAIKVGAFLREGEQLEAEKVSNDEQYEDWKRRMNEWGARAIAFLEASWPEKIEFFRSVSDLGYDAVGSYNELHNHNRVRLKRHCENLKAMLCD